jgi:DNA-directed RNA polymerase subunit F
MNPEEPAKYVSLVEVKNILKKLEKERKELIYEQRIALEHAQKFSKLSIKDTKELIAGLVKLDHIEENHAYKIADILPTSADDVKAIFAKERYTPTEAEIKKILELVGKYYTE